MTFNLSTNGKQENVMSVSTIAIMQVLSSEWALPVSGREEESIIMNIADLLPSYYLVSNKLQLEQKLFSFVSFVG